jgi:hypothetical protein
MENIETNVDISKYPEGLDYLAHVLELPIPKEAMEARKSMVLGLVDIFLAQ